MIRLVAALLLLLGAGPLFAQATGSRELLNEANGTGINPRYLLQDPNGRSVTSEDFRGRFQLISFGYTYCPDICPTTLVEMAEILKQLGDDASRVQAIFISVDPERDTGKVLKTYTEFFDPRILGLTGSPALTRHAADNFKMRYAKVHEPGTPADRYAVDHSAGLILLGPDGAFVKKFAFATPVENITDQMKNFIKNY
ncbi:MAG: SCO family protein [Betaproteobacteria bacterium HGW-Betaproteobacteria-6]|jgi:protein SCO1/2|nr:MAG: SCO family protein [Betaproteobacteria bacterium HGW-Betaproteobacteria-6]